MNKNSGKRSLRDIAMVGVPAALVLIAGFWIAFQFVEPAPPNAITIASGGKDGAYFSFAGQYRDSLAKAGVTLDVRETSGSIENLQLLRGGARDVQIALIQGGVGNPSAMPDLMSLASLYYEPVWVFHRGSRPVTRLDQLTGRRVAVGAEGSGARAVAVQLLADNDLVGRLTRSPLGGVQAAQALIDGRIDAAFFVASPEAEFVRRLLAADGIQIMSFDRAPAYAKHHRYLSRVTLPMGSIDLARNLPRHDVVLLAPTAALVARDDLHPALIELLLQSIGKIHRDGGLFEAPGEFPSSKHLDFPINSDAERYLKSGPNFLHRFLPFWVANFIDRTKVLLLPLITLLIPLFRILPPTYRWRMRSGIIRCYRDLSELDRDLLDREDSSNLAPFTAELERIEDVVTQMHLPPGYLDAVYALRLHIDVVRAKLDRIK